MKKLLFIIGTRPEAIKMAPLIKEAQTHTDWQVKVCVTAQHRQMLDQVLSFFQIVPDYDLNIMKPDQSLFTVTATVLQALEKVLQESRPDLVLVQGDTTTAFVGALAGFYGKVKVAHIEAGLRSGDKQSPFPEEMDRILAGHIADYHFAPTTQAVIALAKEGIAQHVYKVGNTVIDALQLGLKLIGKDDSEYALFYKQIDLTKKIILVTGHRRESFGDGFQQICQALLELAQRFADIEIVYPVHLNPHVREPVYRLLAGHPRIHLLEPVTYPQLIWLMSKSYFVLTDSGGIQEEAPSLGKPVLVMRTVTERTEGIAAGTAILVGTDAKTIVSHAERLLTDVSIYQTMAQAVNPYGDGLASQRIVELIKRF